MILEGDRNMKFRDIEKFIRSGEYEVNVPLTEELFIRKKKLIELKICLLN